MVARASQDAVADVTDNGPVTLADGLAEPAFLTREGVFTCHPEAAGAAVDFVMLALIWFRGGGRRRTPTCRPEREGALWGFMTWKNDRERAVEAVRVCPRVHLIVSR